MNSKLVCSSSRGTGRCWNSRDGTYQLALLYDASLLYPRWLFSRGWIVGTALLGALLRYVHDDFIVRTVYGA